MNTNVNDKLDEASKDMKEMIRDLPKPDPVTHPNSQQREGPIARTIEQQTARLPSDLFLWGALGAMALAVICEVTDRKEKAAFIGPWVPTLLTLGVYNKLVKLHGSDGA